MATPFTAPVFQGLSNFRDLGGLPLANGKCLRPGRWFRSDALSGLTDPDVEALKALRLTVVCDLRTPEERAPRPDRLPRDANIRVKSVPIYHQVPNFLRTDFAACLGDAAKEQAYVDSLREFYVRMALEGGREIGSVTALAMREENLPILIHCMGGKDRTGFACAILELLAGVPRDAVMEDYLASNHLIAPNMRAFIERSSAQVPRERWRPMTDVYRGYLDQALDALFSEYRTIERYYERALGGNLKTLAAFREAAGA